MIRARIVDSWWLAELLGDFLADTILVPPLDLTIRSPGSYVWAGVSEGRKQQRPRFRGFQLGMVTMPLARRLCRAATSSRVRVGSSLAPGETRRSDSDASARRVSRLRTRQRDAGGDSSVRRRR